MVVTPPQAKRGFAPPKRRVVERSRAWRAPAILARHFLAHAHN